MCRNAPIIVLEWAMGTSFFDCKSESQGPTDPVTKANCLGTPVEPAFLFSVDWKSTQGELFCVLFYLFLCSNGEI